MVRDVTIIGAGASGLMCGLTAAGRGRSVVIIDHSPSVAKKVTISGGGRCNFTNLAVGPEHYISANPHFVKSALSRFGPRQFISLLERRGIRYEQKDGGKLFCSGSAREIAEMLRKEVLDGGGEIMLSTEIHSVDKEDTFVVTAGRREIESRSLVVASGGLSYHKLGASDIGYRIAHQFGLGVKMAKPGLVPFLFSKEERSVFAALSGISLTASVSACGKSFTDRVLFTHRGLSGPAILQISNHWAPGEAVTLNLFPGSDPFAVFLERKAEKTELQNVLSAFFPKRFARAWCDRLGPSKPMCQYSLKELKGIAEGLQRWRFVPAGTEGYEAAEVTCGGVDTAELSSKTMEARKTPGLYFIGEVVDVTGELGGYNLHWAWASGYAAGLAV